MAKSIMIQGAGSNVGKSVIVAGLCRAALRRGYSVAPFKPQNMSNNAAVTVDGGEIGRAQALQARAAKMDPIVDMNPILLKPEAETGSQIVVQGQRVASVKAKDYAAWKPKLLPAVLESFERLKEGHDLVIVEGAGSPAEINLRAGDIANMGFAEAADVPVILVGDIDRGGVIAQLVGTQVVLPDADAARIKGYLVNKFRGDPSLFEEGMTAIASATGWTPIGVAPWFADAGFLPAEDSMDLVGRSGRGSIKIAVPRLPRIANFDDLDPLSAELNCELQLLGAGEALPGDTDLVILPGSKATLSDLTWLKKQGWDIDLKAHLRRGGHVLGLCGGYQMLGKWVSDPEGIEGAADRIAGLGLLDVETVMSAEKTVELVHGRATHLGGQAVSGYEIHIGQTDGPDCARPFLDIGGAVDPTGRVTGCYVHGLFSEDAFRHAFLKQFSDGVSDLNYDALVEQVLDKLADHLEAHLDLDALFALAR